MSKIVGPSVRQAIKTSSAGTQPSKGPSQPKARPKAQPSQATHPKAQPAGASGYSASDASIRVSAAEIAAAQQRARLTGQSLSKSAPHVGAQLNKPQHDAHLSASDAQRTKTARAEAVRIQKQADADAVAIWEATDGPGTDEAAIFETLRGKSKAELKALETSFKEHYGRSIQDQIRRDMGGMDREIALRHLAGDHVEANAMAIDRGLGAIWDRSEALETLESANPKSRKAIARAYKTRTGRSLEADLRSRLSGVDQAKALSALKNDPTEAAVAELHQAMDGWGTSESTIERVLSQDDLNMKEVKAAYQARYGHSLESELRRELSGSELTHALERLSGNRTRAEAANLHDKMEGWGTDEAGIESILKGKSKKEIAKLDAVYQEMYGRSIQSELNAELSGLDLERANRLMKGQDISTVQTLRSAMEGWGTDEAAIHAALKDKSKAQIDRIKREYKAETGRELAADLKSELSGRDLFEAEQALKGTPTTAKQAAERANERYDYERGGAGDFGRGLTDLFYESGRIADQNHARLNQAMKQPGSSEDVRRLASYVHADAGSFGKANAEVADVAATVAGTTAGLVASGVAEAVTGGAATPLVAALWGAGLSAGAGTAATLGTKYAILGDTYSGAEMLEDAGAEVLSSGVSIPGDLAAGAFKGSRLVGRGLDFTEQLAGPTTRKATETFGEKAVAGLVNATVGSGYDTLVDPSSFEGTFPEAVDRFIGNWAYNAMDEVKSSALNFGVDQAAKRGLKLDLGELGESGGTRVSDWIRARGHIRP